MSTSPPHVNPTSTAGPAHLRTLNKSSHKISKPLPRPRNPNPNPLASSPPPPAPPPSTAAPPPAPPPPPPVYNIDKSDFRDVVQRLTGSAARRPSPPPSLSPEAAAPPGSRLHRIRPPPLAPPPAGGAWTRPPLSPLPPLPAVSAAAESPISAYMRRLQSGGLPGVSVSVSVAPSSPLGFGGCVPSSPRTGCHAMVTSGLGLPTSPGVELPSPRLGEQ